MAKRHQEEFDRLRDLGKQQADLAAQNKLREEAIRLQQEAIRLQEVQAANDYRNLGIVDKLNIKLKTSADALSYLLNKQDLTGKVTSSLDSTGKSVDSFSKRFSNTLGILNEQAGKPFEGLKSSADRMTKSGKQSFNSMKDSMGNFVFKLKEATKLTRTLEEELDEVNQAIKEGSTKGPNKLNDGTIKQMQEEADELDKRINSPFRTGLSSAIEKTTSGIKKGAAATLTFAGGAVVGLIGMITRAMLFALTRLSEVEDAVIKIKKQFGFTNKRVEQFKNYIDSTRGDFLAMGLSSDDVSTNISEIVGVLGSARKITNDELNLINLLNAKLGVSAEVAAGVLDVFQLYGPETVKQSDAAISALVNMAESAGISFNIVANDLASNAEGILTSFSGYDTELAKAAIQARMLGIDIGRVASISEGLLDFETSITNEMKAEVLLGRDLEFGRLRAAAFSGDALEVTEAIADMTRQIGSLDGMNLFQKKALADAVGMSVLELQKAFKLQTDLNRLTADERKQWSLLADAQKKQVEGEASMQEGLRKLRAMEPLLNSVDKLKAKWGQLKELLARPLSRVISIIAGKFDSVLGKLQAQLNGGSLMSAFERFGKVIGDIMDKIFDEELINSITAFINKSIEWVKRIVTTANVFFEGVSSFSSVSQNASDVTEPGKARKAEFMGTIRTTKVESANTEKMDDGIVQNGRIITTHPEDYLIATKDPQSLIQQPVIVKQEFPSEILQMVKSTNVLLDKLLREGVSATIGSKQVNRSVYTSNNVR